MVSYFQEFLALFTTRLQTKKKELVNHFQVRRQFITNQYVYIILHTLEIYSRKIISYMSSSPMAIASNIPKLEFKIDNKNNTFKKKFKEIILN